MKDKYCWLARATLPALFVTAALVLNPTAIAQAPPGSLWYNGDWNLGNSIPNERNTLVSQAAVYDDFDVTASQGWHVTAVFSNDMLFVNPPGYVAGADWEIRTGVSEGNPGTLVASGTTQTPLVTFTFRSQNEFMIEVTGLNVFLPMLPSGQHYWLNVTPVGNGTGYYFNSGTSGTNCVGTPCGNDDSAFFNSKYFGAFFDHSYNWCDGCNDFSMGVIGTVVPEPATVALLTCGLGALLIAMRRRRAFPRATLSALFVAAAFVLNATAIAQPPPGSLRYNGDFNFSGSYTPNERNTLVSQAAVYDDFDVTASQGWHVTAVFSNDMLFVNPPGFVAGADWEIRTGVSEGNPGTLVASGTTQTPLVTFTFRTQFEFTIEVTGLNLFLPMLPSGQHYWLNVTPVGNGTGLYYNSDTNGTNCVGTPCGNDDNAFFNSTYFGTFFTSTNNYNGQHDFSMGVIGTVVPEPATVTLLTCGLGALLIAVPCRRWTKLVQRFSARAITSG